MPLRVPQIDNRSYQQLLDEALARIRVHTPQWTNYNDSDPGITLLQLFAFLSDLIRRTGSIDYARRVALQAAARATRVLDTLAAWTFPSVHVTFLRELVAYVVERDR